jgi:hypothetical protein
MHAPPSVAAAEQEGCKALDGCRTSARAWVRIGRYGYLGRLVCGGERQFKTLLLQQSSVSEAGKNGEKKAPPNHRQTGRQKKKGRKSLATRG